MAEIPANTPQDWGMRGATNTTLPQFKGKPRQLIINVDDGYRPVIMDGNTLGGKFKCASVSELDAIKDQIKDGITQTEADARYLGIHAKADSAKMADEAMHASSADTASHADTASNADEALRANEATKATQDKNGQDISLTYATKQELNTGLGNKLGKTEKAISATVADSANAVAWANVSDKPNASENSKGVIQLANASDISAGTDTTKAVTPKQLKDGLNEKLGRNEKASSASVADRATVANSADSVQWNNVQGRPTIGPAPNAYITNAWRSGSQYTKQWSDGFKEQLVQVQNVNHSSFTPLLPLPSLSELTYCYIQGFRSGISTFGTSKAIHIYSYTIQVIKYLKDGRFNVAFTSPAIDGTLTSTQYYIYIAGYY